MEALPWWRALARAGLRAGGYFAARDRRWERQVSCDPGRLEPFEDGLPMPPPYLITLVGGTPSQRWFSEHGEQQAALISRLIADEGLSLSGGVHVLDFGCGCGRIARRLAPLVEAAGGVFYGIDLQGPLVDWCAANLAGRYAKGGLRPPSHLAAASLDVVYAYSVLTHLTEATTVSWLAEFRRLLKPGGLAVVTFQDEDFNSGTVKDDLLRQGYLVSSQQAEGRNHMSAWTSRSRFQILAESYFKVSKIIASDEARAQQAFAVLRKTPAS